MEKWDPLDFVWPRLHEAMQTRDDAASDAADAAWERAVELYDDYLKSVRWPKGFRDLLDNGSLHDATAIDWWPANGGWILTLRQDNGAWDGRDYIAVVQWHDPVFVSSTLGKEGVKSYWLYDQLADLGGGRYRHHLHFTDGTFVIDCSDVTVTRVFQPLRQRK